MQNIIFVKSQYSSWTRRFNLQQKKSVMFALQGEVYTCSEVYQIALQNAVDFIYAYKYLCSCRNFIIFLFFSCISKKNSLIFALAIGNENYRIALGRLV
jgi:hypothetical protein